MENRIILNRLLSPPMFELPEEISLTYTRSAIPSKEYLACELDLTPAHSPERSIQHTFLDFDFELDQNSRTSPIPKISAKKEHINNSSKVTTSKFLKQKNQPTLNNYQTFEQATPQFKSFPKRLSYYQNLGKHKSPVRSQLTPRVEPLKLEDHFAPKRQDLLELIRKRKNNMFTPFSENITPKYLEPVSFVGHETVSLLATPARYKAYSNGFFGQNAEKNKTENSPFTIRPSTRSKESRTTAQTHRSPRILKENRQRQEELLYTDKKSLTVHSYTLQTRENTLSASENKREMFLAVKQSLKDKNPYSKKKVVFSKKNMYSSIPEPKQSMRLR